MCAQPTRLAVRRGVDRRIRGRAHRGRARITYARGLAPRWGIPDEGEARRVLSAVMHPPSYPCDATSNPLLPPCAGQLDDALLATIPIRDRHQSCLAGRRLFARSDLCTLGQLVRLQQASCVIAQICTHSEVPAAGAPPTRACAWGSGRRTLCACAPFDSPCAPSAGAVLDWS